MGSFVWRKPNATGNAERNSARRTLNGCATTDTFDVAGASILFGEDDENAAPAVPSKADGETFAESCSKLTRQELTFVQKILIGAKPKDAARTAFPSKKTVNAAELERKPHIAHAIELGRRELAVEVQRDARYTVVEAIAEVDEKIKSAHARGADSAIASMLQLKAKLAGLLVDRHEVQSAGFQIVVSGVDPSRMSGQARVIDGEVIEEGRE